MRSIAPRAGRTVEARLTGFAWSPMRVQRGRDAAPLDPARLELAGAAGAVIEKTPGGHDAGVGYLVIDRDADAVEALQEAARKSPGDAKIWSDLAAARYTLAVREEKTYELPLALAAADRALRIAPDLDDALFNRALIIERLGVNEAARRAWQRYLQADGTSKWSDEALQHLGRLDVVATRVQFERDLARARAALAHGDIARLAALTRMFPQEARTWGETLLLGEWADALGKGNEARAAEALAVVRETSRALADSNHEHLLADVVQSIDAADADRRRTIAAAQGAYLQGRILYSRRRVAEADALFRKSAGLFAQAASPMAHLADYYTAQCLYDGNRAAEAQRMLLAIAARTDAARYPSLHAQLRWGLSLTERLDGSWGSAIRYAQEASRTFAALGETMNRANVDLLLADAYDHSAQGRAAWKARPAAFRALSAAGAPDRIAAALSDATGMLTRVHPDAALALADVTVDQLQQRRNPRALALTHVYRARLLGESDQAEAGRKAIAEARAAAQEIPDVAMRSRIGARIDIATGIVQRRSNPRGSIESLNHALEFFDAHRERVRLADTYLQRGRTRVLLGDEAGALSDFQSGLNELESQRSQLVDEELRSSFYDTEPDLFAETIALHLRRGDRNAAFAAADRVRARSLDERQVAEPQAVRALPAGTALIEYAVLNDSVAIFCLTDRNALQVETVRIESDALQRLVDHFDDLLIRRADVALVENDAAALYRLLVEPVARHIAGASRLVVVPDRELNAVPFAALLNPATHRYLVQDLTIAFAPNAAFASRAFPPLALSPALIIGDPKSESTPALPDAVREAEAIAGMYSAAVLLSAERATPQRFVEAAQRSGVIHYSGHAQSDADTAYGTLRLAPEGSGSGVLDAGDIAAMRLRAAPLVVLAACGTIRGETEHVEGMPSLARAFLAAGARGVIGTLWEIDDDTASRLFRTVHQELRKGQSPAAALRAAQLDAAANPDPRVRHPSTWAPVQVLGSVN